MAEPEMNKHQRNSARTRDKLVTAAQELYGSRSIDAVSLREISARAGQRNPNALQYHFHNRDGLLQAIVDKHATEVGTYRERYFELAQQGQWNTAEAAARCLVMPIVDYVERCPEAVNFVRIVSQIRALNRGSQHRSERQDNTGEFRFPDVPGLEQLFGSALAELSPREAQRRIHLVVNTVFHAIADIYREDKSNRAVSARGPMVEQLVCLVESFLATPAREAHSG